MDATPAPKKMIEVRFEDMVFKQEETLKRLEGFLEKPLAKIEMRRDSVGRYKTDNGDYMFDCLKPELEKWGYTD
ncbi:MAG: sulfotransferase [Clostridiales bacterium]|nr:sulfotransferase [Clostridiales bacterium]